MRKGGGTHRSWLIVTSVESLDKEEVEWIEKELEDINIGALELDEYDERDKMKALEVIPFRIDQKSSLAACTE